MSLDKLPKLLGRFVLVRIPKVEERVDGGIVMPETRSELPQEGVVVRVGDGGEIPMDVAVGQTVVIPIAGHIELTINDEPYLIVKEEDILAVREA